MSKIKLNLQFFAQKKGGGSASTNCNHGQRRIPKCLGVKIFDGSFCKEGSIIVRQRGSNYKKGKGVFYGKDYTVHAKWSGIVKFNKKGKKKTTINVLPSLKKNE